MDGWWERQDRQDGNARVHTDTYTHETGLNGVSLGAMGPNLTKGLCCCCYVFGYIIVFGFYRLREYVFRNRKAYISSVNIIVDCCRSINQEKPYRYRWFHPFLGSVCMKRYSHISHYICSTWSLIVSMHIQRRQPSKAIVKHTHTYDITYEVRTPPTTWAIEQRHHMCQQHLSIRRE